VILWFNIIGGKNARKIMKITAAVRFLAARRADKKSL